MKSVKKVLDTARENKTISKVTSVKTMSLKTMSDDDLVDLFSQAFEDKVAKYNEIESFDVIVKRSTGDSGATVEVTISGTAGSPTVDQWRNCDVENAKQVTISRDDKGEATFSLIPEDTVYLNSTEYIVTYKA